MSARQPLRCVPSPRPSFLPLYHVHLCTERVADEGRRRSAPRAGNERLQSKKDRADGLLSNMRRGVAYHGS